jgi:hypothetical protein
MLTLDAGVGKKSRPGTTRSKSGRLVAPDCLIASAVITDAQLFVHIKEKLGKSVTGTDDFKLTTA